MSNYLDWMNKYPERYNLLYRIWDTNIAKNDVYIDGKLWPQLVDYVHSSDALIGKDIAKSLAFTVLKARAERE